MTTNDKADSNTNPGGAGNAATPKTENTASAKAAARRKQQQLKNQKNTQPAKKKQPQQHAIKSTFEGIASGVNPMKGTVIAQDNGNMSGQFRTFQKKLAGAAADDKAYGLDSSILDLVAKTRSDFVKPKPSPNIHSNLVPEMNAAGDATGGNVLVCHNPALKEQMDAEYNMDLKIQCSNYNQFQRHEEAYFRIAIGNVESEVITHCRRDNRMTVVENNKDLIGFLLILRSVCAQNKGSVKVDEEYQNLGTLHAALAYRQKKSVNNTTFGEDVLNRYESAIFTCGKFAFGQAIYDKVLANYSTPMTFAEYLSKPLVEQEPIDEIVKERTVGRLIIKNSLNEQLREYLIHTYSVNNNTCYPNTISDAVSLLSTFKKASAITNGGSPEDAVVSYHEMEMDYNNDEECDDDDNDVTANTADYQDDADDTVEDLEGTNTNHEDIEEEHDSHVSFDATVMAAVIAEATAEANADQFIGASFGGLQDVTDVYEKDEPDIVVGAHIVDSNNNDEDSDFVDEANSNATDNNERIRRHGAIITPHPNPIMDFELLIYHTAQRVLLNETTNVYVFNYEQNRPDLISHTYDSPVPESIIDYSDALRFKLKSAGIHDVTRLMFILSSRTDAEAMACLKRMLNEVGMKGLSLNTVKTLRKEAIRTIAHVGHNNIRFHTMEMEIGVDSMMNTFPPENALLHHVVAAVAINQGRRKPNRWVNKMTRKLIDAGITSIQQLESKLDSNSLNNHLKSQGMPTLHDITIMGFIRILGTADFRQGRS
jgi:hypothetical protein